MIHLGLYGTLAVAIAVIGAIAITWFFQRLFYGHRAPHLRARRSESAPASTPPASTPEPSRYDSCQHDSFHPLRRRNRRGS